MATALFLKKKGAAEPLGPGTGWGRLGAQLQWTQVPWRRLILLFGGFGQSGISDHSKWHAQQSPAAAAAAGRERLWVAKWLGISSLGSPVLPLLKEKKRKEKKDLKHGGASNNRQPI